MVQLDVPLALSSSPLEWFAYQGEDRVSSHCLQGLLLLSAFHRPHKKEGDVLSHNHNLELCEKLWKFYPQPRLCFKIPCTKKILHDKTLFYHLTEGIGNSASLDKWSCCLLIFWGTVGSLAIKAIDSLQISMKAKAFWQKSVSLYCFLVSRWVWLIQELCSYWLPAADYLAPSPQLWRRVQKTVSVNSESPLSNAHGPP